MDKGLMRFKKGRVGIAIAIAACMLIALPASAFAASNFFPADGGSITAKSPVVSLVFSGSNLDARTATIMLGATALPVQTSATNGGSWSTGDPVLVNGVYKMSWQWTPGTLTTGQVKAWAFLPSATPTGTVSLTASIKDTAGVVADAGAWSFTLVAPSPNPGNPGGPGSDVHSMADMPCAKCHGYDLRAPHGAGCVCHEYADAGSAHLADVINNSNGNADCVDCHAGNYAPHGFAGTAGGHNTPLYDVNGGAESFGEGHIVVKSSKETTIEQHWTRPTASVFWSQSKALSEVGGVTVETPGTFSLNPTDSPTVAMGARKRVDGTTVDLSGAINTTVGWDSVITCYDCHTELEGLTGPQGANAANYGLDPNFPDDWTRAELTSFDPTGMRSIATTLGSPNQYYTKWGSRQFWPAVSTDTTSKALISGQPATAIIYAGGSYEATSVTSNGYSAGNVEGAFLCQKCHKLVNSYQGLAIEGNGSGFRSNNLAQIGYGNYPHMEHHGDMVTGQGNCVSCHIAIPHGWKRPRLLVYATDPAPYKKQWVYSGYRSGTFAAKTGAYNPNADLNASIAATDFNGYVSEPQTQEGNWGWLGLNQYATSGNMYQVLNTTMMVAGTPSNAANWADPLGNTGTFAVPITAHLSGLSAGADSHKEIENPGVDEGRETEDDFNAQAAVQAAGLEVEWSKWMWEDGAGFGGVEWHTDNTPGANGYNPDPSLNAQHYNNCNGCTSASNNRHTPHNAGVSENVPAWK